MTNKHIELPALARTLAYDVQAETIGPALADMISDTLNRCADAIAAHEQARVVGEPVATGPLSYVCVNGCGYCGVRLSDFVTHQTMDQDSDVWKVVASEPQIVSTCCGSAVEVWDERKQDVTGTVEIASPPAPQEAQADSTPLLPVARIRSWTKHGEGHGDLVDWLEGSENLPDGEYDLYLGPQSEQKPVASIYISPNGEREFDDWKHDLPIGRNELFAAPVAQPASVTTTAHAIHEALNPGAPVEWPLEDEEQPATAQAEAPGEREILVAKLQACADDPMWANHAEISKRTLRQAIVAINNKPPENKACTTCGGSDWLPGCFTDYVRSLCLTCLGKDQRIAAQDVVPILLWERVVEEFAGLLQQVEVFCSKHGEADFEIGNALKVIGEAVDFEGKREATQPTASNAGERATADTLPFICTNGCGYCGVKLRDFVTHATQAQDSDTWVTVASEPEIVSTCCGHPVEVWDERKQDVVAEVRAALASKPVAPPAREATKLVQRWMEMIDYAYQCRDDIRSSSGATPRSQELRLLADEMSATLSATTPAPAGQRLDLVKQARQLAQNWSAAHDVSTCLEACAFALASPPEKITEEMHAAAVSTLVRCTGNDEWPQRVWDAMHRAARGDEVNQK